MQSFGSARRKRTQRCTVQHNDTEHLQTTHWKWLRQKILWCMYFTKIQLAIHHYLYMYRIQVTSLPQLTVTLRCWRKRQPVWPLRLKLRAMEEQLMFFLKINYFIYLHPKCFPPPGLPSKICPSSPSPLRLSLCTLPPWGIKTLQD